MSPLRVAFVGKGGSGKSAIAGTLARLLARSGAPVLAVDSDPMPGLAFSLGLAIDDARIPDEAVVERGDDDGEGPPYRLAPRITAEAAVSRYAVTAPDGVRFLQMGKLRGSASTTVRSQHAFRQIMDELPDDRWNVVGDLPGGTRQLFFGWGDYAHTLIAVVEPTAKSMLSARRLRRFPLDGDGGGGPNRLVAVVNKARERRDTSAVQERTGIEVVGTVPWDRDFAGAERDGLAPLDHCPGTPAVEAVASVLTYLRDGSAP